MAPIIDRSAMSVLDKIFAAGKAIKAGESLKEPGAWKNKQLLMNVFSVILGTVPVFVDIDIPDGDLNSIAYGFATFVIVLNAYFTAATSDKVGLPDKRKNN